MRARTTKLTALVVLAALAASACSSSEADSDTANESGAVTTAPEVTTEATEGTRTPHP